MHCNRQTGLKITLEVLKSRNKGNFQRTKGSKITLILKDIEFRGNLSD